VENVGFSNCFRLMREAREAILIAKRSLLGMDPIMCAGLPT
jgi:hypothetical protein